MSAGGRIGPRRPSMKAERKQVVAASPPPLFLSLQHHGIQFSLTIKMAYSISHLYPLVHTLFLGVTGQTA